MYFLPFTRHNLPQTKCNNYIDLVTNGNAVTSTFYDFY
jgi:hypothetical protein